MSIARSLLLKAAASPWLERQLTSRAFARRAVRRFMPGEALEAALDAAAALPAAGITGTVVTQLGENLTSLAEAAAVRDHYLAAFDAIAHRGLAAWPSVKPTQLGLDLSAEACRAHCEALAERARTLGSLLWIDMEDSSCVDRTLALYRGLRERGLPVGLAMQAYLYRTPNDLAALRPLNPIVRLVKGAYAEPASVAFPRKADVDRAFESLAQTLLEIAAGGALQVVGTHDIPLIRRIERHAGRLGVRADQWEVHMLYGIRDADQRALAAEGRRVRTLISYGRHWYKWYMRRLAERPANVWFVVKSLV